MHDAAALFIDPAGPYARLPNVDAWDIARDATRYAGSLPVVAHPPCGTWGKYAHRCKQPGRDAAHSALASVRRWHGVMEHPLHSHFWTVAQIPTNSRQLDFFRGWTIAIDQFRFGLPALKPTTLYIVGTDRTPPLPPPRTTRPRPYENLTRRTRAWTPPDLAAWLIELAKSTAA